MDDGLTTGDGDGQDALRSELVGVLRRVHRGAFVVTAAEEADALLPHVTAYAERVARERAAAIVHDVARSLPPTRDREANRLHDTADALARAQAAGLLNTDEDRERAAHAFSEWVNFTAGDGHRSIGRATDEERIDAIAAALAAERERVAAPVRALAEEWSTKFIPPSGSVMFMRHLADRLRAVLPPQPDTDDRTGQR